MRSREKMLKNVREIGKKREKKMNETLNKIWIRGTEKLREIKGQGTTEYAILVGVLVVIAIIAVVAFRGKLQELWTSITTNINNL
jgi:Flp pilus assembly pilin Flp